MGIKQKEQKKSKKNITLFFWLSKSTSQAISASWLFFSILLCSFLSSFDSFKTSPGCDFFSFLSRVWILITWLIRTITLLSISSLTTSLIPEFPCYLWVSSDYDFHESPSSLYSGLMMRQPTMMKMNLFLLKSSTDWNYFWNVPTNLHRNFR